uniref:Cytochrome b5 heme-binding domain-containing protein n=1 Tax=Heligmosomoides polygyrus TaxID=6339 RepID=A0A183GAQ7_HELPZ
LVLHEVFLQIYDTSRGRNFYDPGGPCGALAGRDATRAPDCLPLRSMDLRENRNHRLGNRLLESCRQYETMHDTTITTFSGTWRPVERIC